MEADLSITLDNHRTLWLTEISRAAYEEQALEGLGSDGGIFVVLEDTSAGKYEVLGEGRFSMRGRGPLGSLRGRIF